MRLLFDENLPWRVAAALRTLEFSVSYVGDDSASPPSPGRGSSDEEVLSHAENANQLVVTSNLDMILLCVERGQSMIWIDPRGEHLRRAELVLIVFKGIDDWSERLATTDEPVCLRAMRTRTNTLTTAPRRFRLRSWRLLAVVATDPRDDCAARCGGAPH